MEITRDSVLSCFARGLTIRQTEVSLSVPREQIREKYPDVYKMFERRRYLITLERHAKIVEEWVISGYCSYSRVRWLLERKNIMIITDPTVQEATSRYMPVFGEKEIISIMSKL